MCHENSDIVSLLSRSGLIIGLKQVLKTVGQSQPRCVILALDADKDVRNKVEHACVQHSVKVEYFPSKRELGRLCGIEVACACAAISK